MYLDCLAADGAVMRSAFADAVACLGMWPARKRLLINGPRLREAEGAPARACVAWRSPITRPRSRSVAWASLPW